MLKLPLGSPERGTFIFGIDDIALAVGGSALLGAAGNIGGGLISSAGQANANAQNLQIAREQMQFSAQQAKQQMDFQERMSGSQYQRGMADMKAAGLNPLLAYQQGGASAPQGAMGQSAGATMQNAEEGIARGVTSAGQAGKDYMALRQVAATTMKDTTAGELNAAQVDYSKANTIKTAQETITSAEDAARKRAETALLTEQIKNPEAQRVLMGHQGTAAKAAAYASTKAGDYSKAQTDQLVNIGPGKFATEVMSPVSRLIDLVKRVYSAPSTTHTPQPQLGNPNTGYN